MPVNHEDVRRGRRSSNSMPLLLIAATVDAVGSGLYLTAGIVYLIHGAGFSATYVAGSLLVGGLLGTITSVAVGYIADRCGPISTIQVTYGAQAVGMLIITIDARRLVLVALLTYLVGQKCTGSLAGAVVAWVATAETRVTSRASLRASTNGGLALGALAAGLLLATVDYRQLWIVPLVNTVSFVLAMAMVELMRGSVPTRKQVQASSSGSAARTRTWTVSRRFLVLCLIGGSMQIHFDVQAVLLPLWLLTLPDAVPRWSVGYVFAVNTFIVLTGLRWHARLMEQTRTRRRAGAASGVAMGTSLLGYFSLSSIHTRPVGMLVLTLAVIWHSVGEILHANAFGAASFDLAEEHRQGYHQSIYFSAASGLRSAGPTIMMVLISTKHVAGWVALAAMFVGMGVLGTRVIPEHAMRTAALVPPGDGPDQRLHP
jgi:NADH:ubiquinone oxidoreductase subunit 3 (subunit A)